MAIPKPEPRDWQIANAQELQVTDREVLRMLREAKKRVDAILKELPAGKQEVRRAQLEQTRARLLAEQADIFERLGDIVSARRARAASRSAGLSAAGDAALLSLVGKGPQGQYLYESALQVGQRQIEAALARMKLSQLPLSKRIYNTSVWMGNRLGRLINETLATGLNAQEFARRARDWFNPNTPGGVRYAALRLARTEINNAFHAMSAAKYADTPWIKQVEWNLSKSHPKPDVCNEVAAGSPYPADRVPARPHPQCMCYITPKAIGEDDFVDNFVNGDYDDYLDAELKKNGWFEEHPEDKPLVNRMPAAPGPTKDTKRMPTTQVPGLPEGDGDPQLTTLREAGLLEIGSEFLYHGYTKRNYTIIPKHVRVAPGKPGGSVNSRQLFDVQTGKYVEQQDHANAKWWIEKIVANPAEEAAAPEPPQPTFAERVENAATRKDALLSANYGLERQLGSKNYNRMTSEQRRGVRQYTGNWYKEINRHLRGEKIEIESDLNTVKEYVESVDDVMKTARLSREVLVYRGMHNASKIFGDRMEGDLTGMEWLEKAYVSTTAVEQRTRTFLGSPSAPHRVLMRILLPAGTAALEASPLNTEAEMLVNRDTKFRVVADNGVDENGIRRIDVELFQ